MTAKLQSQLGFAVIVLALCLGLSYCNNQADYHLCQRLAIQSGENPKNCTP